jgi:hypothetical protein
MGGARHVQPPDPHHGHLQRRNEGDHRDHRGPRRCLYTKILIGLGGDGTPDSTTRKITVPDGTTVLTPQQLAALAAQGLSTIEDILALQITAGR